MMTGFFAHLDKVTTAVGNTVSGPISYDVLIDALERVDLTFDNDGEHGAVAVMNRESYARLMQQGPPTAAQQARLDEVMRRKREEFHARRRRRSVPRDGQ